MEKTMQISKRLEWLYNSQIKQTSKVIAIGKNKEHFTMVIGTTPWDNSTSINVYVPNSLKVHEETE